MSRGQIEAQIKAAAWAAVAALGLNEAIRLLEAVREELVRSQWDGPGGR